MSRLRTYFFLGLVLTVSLVACNGGEKLPVSIASLRMELPDLEAVAREWRADAYLVEATVELLNERSSRSAATAYFQSPSTEFEGILVYLERDGSISTELVPYERPVLVAIPITNADWQIDAAEALDLGLSDDARRYLEENSDSQCSFMILERDTPESPQRVVWRIELGGCLLDPAFQRIVVDASTGEVLRQSIY